MRIWIRILVIALCTMLQACNGSDQPRFEVEIRIRDNVFVPQSLTVPADRAIKLIVHNDDDTVEEFESYSLRREKIIPPHGAVTILLAPLKVGEYKFFGEFHEETANGMLIVEQMKGE